MNSLLAVLLHVEKSGLNLLEQFFGSVAMCGSVWQFAAVCCSVLQCGAVQVCCSIMSHWISNLNLLQAPEWCSVVQFGAMWYSVVQCDAVRCSVVQCGLSLLAQATHMISHITCESVENVV